MNEVEFFDGSRHGGIETHQIHFISSSAGLPTSSGDVSVVCEAWRKPDGYAKTTLSFLCWPLTEAEALIYSSFKSADVLQPSHVGLSRKLDFRFFGCSGKSAKKVPKVVY